MLKTTNTDTAKILSLSGERAARHSPTAREQIAPVIPLPCKANVVASITIELRRGGKIDTRLHGVNPGNAYRLAASMIRALAEVFALLKGSR